MNYLKRQSLKYEFQSSFFLAIIVIISFVLGKYLSLKNPWFYIPIFISWLIIVLILQLLSQRAENRQKAHIKGEKGEKFIEEILQKLPSNYRYIHSIKLMDGNLDFLIISDNGVFGIETKNQNGKITYDEKNKQLLRNYYPFHKNYLKQVKKCCFDTNKIIKEKLNIDCFVVPVLVFSGLGVSIETPPRIDGVNILGSEMLLDFLTKRRDVALDAMHQENIYKLFSDLNKK